MDWREHGYKVGKCECGGDIIRRWPLGSHGFCEECDALYKEVEE